MGPRGGSHETAKPNHEENNTRLGFDKKRLPTGVQKLGSRLVRLGFAVFDPNLRSLTSSRIFDFVMILLGFGKTGPEVRSPVQELRSPNRFCWASAF